MEIKPDLNASLGLTGTSAAARGGRIEQGSDDAARVDNQRQSGTDQIQLSVTGTAELAHAQRLEALEEVVAEGNYRPAAKHIASSIVEHAISDTADPK